ncbi:adenylate/guanylate cyclase domain-containing protein [Chryseosolibacter indicus]|uniref:Adenylate/guanylate cyclase domain-containing protein n=1 Tax=Chryseosolibacter indicus TaxID=2782351 RepID=A0ABS5VTZ8_9BACT|nr:adenylate/guanylate cyclase domain-containing protein [Chryseosolibacter indicus]MBT1704302.1 adenylate/guanylate cyclase domain-containing protein [Chryseosolibacter indicus]
MTTIANNYTWAQHLSLDLNGIGRRISTGIAWFKNLNMPLEENRIFLFVDLNNSTSLAERMGNVRYSMFLSSFFRDFRLCLRKTTGKIYQYVGDEIVVSWPNSRKNLLESIQLVSKFQQALNELKHIYQRKFNFIPEFKAALHQGKVAVTRVGFQKVYRGDILNTCARMLELASRLKLALVTSCVIAEYVKKEMDYCINPIEGVAIRGKAKPMDIYAILK